MAVSLTDYGVSTGSEKESDSAHHTSKATESSCVVRSFDHLDIRRSESASVVSATGGKNPSIRLERRCAYQPQPGQKLLGRRLKFFEDEKTIARLDDGAKKVIGIDKQKTYLATAKHRGPMG